MLLSLGLKATSVPLYIHVSQSLTMSSMSWQCESYMSKSASSSTANQSDLLAMSILQPARGNYDRSLTQVRPPSFYLSP